MGFLGTVLCIVGVMLVLIAAVRLAGAKSGTPAGDNMASLLSAVQRGVGTWAAKDGGECCSCGHEWEPGEIIGLVTQAYMRFDDGAVLRSPGTRVACLVCVERQRVEADLSITWAREAGLL